MDASYTAPIDPKRRFTGLLALALTLPAALSVAAWLLQLFAKFPPRSPGASMTAVVFVVAPLIELVAVPIAVNRLIRHPVLRTWKNLVLTLIGALSLLLALMLVAALALVR